MTRTVIRLNHFMSAEEFDRIKKEWEQKNPDTCLIPYTMSLENHKRGHWQSIKNSEWNGGGFYKCSWCGYGYSWGQFDLADFNYCPNCGAEMEDNNEMGKDWAHGEGRQI